MPCTPTRIALLPWGMVVSGAMNQKSTRPKQSQSSGEAAQLPF